MFKKTMLTMVTLLTVATMNTTTVNAAETYKVDDCGEIYDAIVESLYDFEDEINLVMDFTLTESRADRVILNATNINFGIMGNYDLTWCDGVRIRYTYDNNGNVAAARIRPVYNTTQKEIQTVEKWCKHWVATELEDIDDDYMKVEIIHDYLVNHITYTGTEDEIGQYAYRTPYIGIYYGMGVCTTYTGLFQLLCEEAGIECIYTCNELPAGRHVWNYVNIDGHWYGVDCTFDDYDNGRISYDYFLSNEGHLGSMAPGIRVENFY